MAHAAPVQRRLRLKRKRLAISLADFKPKQTSTYYSMARPRALSRAYWPKGLMDALGDSVDSWEAEHTLHKSLDIAHHTASCQESRSKSHTRQL